MLFVRRFRRFGGDEFLEARIIPKRIEHRIEPEQRRSERHARQPARHRTGSRVVSVKRRWRGRVPPCAPPPGRGSRSDWDHQGVLLDRIRGHGPLRQSQRGGFVTETHIGQREISNEADNFPAVL